MAARRRAVILWSILGIGIALGFVALISMTPIHAPVYTVRSEIIVKTEPLEHDADDWTVGPMEITLVSTTNVTSFPVIVNVLERLVGQSREELSTQVLFPEEVTRAVLDRTKSEVTLQFIDRRRGALVFDGDKLIAVRVDESR